jgi:hypothetical protein
MAPVGRRRREMRKMQRRRPSFRGGVNASINPDRSDEADADGDDPDRSVELPSLALRVGIPISIRGGGGSLGGPGLDGRHLEFGPGASEPTVEVFEPKNRFFVVQGKRFDAVFAAYGGHFSGYGRQVQQAQRQVVQSLGVVGLKCHEGIHRMEEVRERVVMVEGVEFDRGC